MRVDSHFTDAKRSSLCKLLKTEIRTVGDDLDELMSTAAMHVNRSIPMGFAFETCRDKIFVRNR